MKGKSAHTTKLEFGNPAQATNNPSDCRILKEATIARWSPSGNEFALVYGSKISLRPTKDGTERKLLNLNKQINAMVFVSVRIVSWNDIDVRLGRSACSWRR